MVIKLRFSVLPILTGRFQSTGNNNHATRADLLRRAGWHDDALAAYQ